MFTRIQSPLLTESQGEVQFEDRIWIDVVCGGTQTITLTIKANIGCTESVIKLKFF